MDTTVTGFDEEGWREDRCGVTSPGTIGPPSGARLAFAAPLTLVSPIAHYSLPWVAGLQWLLLHTTAFPGLPVFSGSYCTLQPFLGCCSSVVPIAHYSLPLVAALQWFILLSTDRKTVMTPLNEF